MDCFFLVDVQSNDPGFILCGYLDISAVIRSYPIITMIDLIADFLHGPFDRVHVRRVDGVFREQDFFRSNGNPEFFANTNRLV